MNGSQGRQLIYLLLTISGTVLTQQANWQFIQENGGFALGEFIAQAGATAAGQSLSWDLVIGATAGVMAMIVEGRRLQMRHLHWPVLASMLIAFAAGAPLFLLMRERHLQQLEDANG